jgi:hypothetical protein
MEIFGELVEENVGGDFFFSKISIPNNNQNLYSHSCGGIQRDSLSLDFKAFF